jgi:hypothetical protein
MRRRNCTARHRSRYMTKLIALIVVTLVAITAPAPAGAQAVITVNEDVKLQFGVLGQFWGDTIDSPTTDDNTSNLFIRRVRLLFGGQVAKNVSFFIETDSPNLGRVLPGGKNITPSVIVQDAWGTFRAGNFFMLDAGLMFVPFSRNAVQSAATLLPIDYGAFTFIQSGPTQSSTGRDTGFQARGYLLEQHLEYRIGAFQGVRNTLSTNEFRYAGRAQYNFFDTETAFFYTGTYLGKKRILAVAAAFDKQSDYHAYDADVFVDIPFRGGAITGQVDYNHFNNSRTLSTLPRENIELVEAGYLFTPIRLTPFLQFTNRDVTDVRTGDDRRWTVGLSYWWAGHNANIKGAYTRIAPPGGPRQNEFTVQFQVFYY